MIYSVRTFLSQSRRISIDREGGGGGRKGRKRERKKGGWFYRRATKGNDGRLSLVQGSLIEGETSSNLDAASSSAPPSSPSAAVIANLGCGLQSRRIPKGESRNLLSRVPPTTNSRHTISPNQPLFSFHSPSLIFLLALPILENLSLKSKFWLTVNRNKKRILYQKN